MRRATTTAALVLAAATGWYAGRVQARAEQTTSTSGVVTIQQAQRAESGTWGEFRRHFNGATPGTADMMTGLAVVLPGAEIHPPHTHPEEEFMFLSEGSGTWHLDGKDIPARTGDVLYAEPNVSHGLTNTSDKPLKFFVVKWKAK